MKKVEALAEYLGIKEEDLKESYREDIFETYDGEEYLILTDDEADKEFYDYEDNLIDELGMTSFTPWAQEYILDNFVDTDWFEDYMEESYTLYCDDIETESASTDEYENRLEEEMAENNCESKEEYVEYLCSGYDDATEWFRFDFGDDEFSKVVNDYNLMNTDEVIEWLKDEDGRGCISGYDGKEVEYDEYFIYRIN